MKTTNSGFTLIETAIAVTLIALASAFILVEGGSIMSNSRQEAAKANAATLNFAMSEYRDYLARGYRPDTAWTATTAEGIFTELRKPLRKGSQTVYALSEQAIDEGTAVELARPRNAANASDDYSPDCVWFPVAPP